MLSGLPGGSALWTTMIPLPVDYVEAVSADPTGRAFLALHFASASVHAVDVSGTYLGSVASSPGTGAAAPGIYFRAYGAHHYLLDETYPAHMFGMPNTPISVVTGDMMSGTFADPAYPEGVSLIVSPAGDVFGASWSYSGTAQLLGFGTGGTTPVWSKPMVQFGDELTIETDAAGHLHAAGFNAQPLDLGCGTLPGMAWFVAELTPSGQCVYSRSLPGIKSISGFASQASGMDGIVLVGTASQSGVDLGCGPMNGTAVLAKLDGAGACVWSTVTAASRAATMPSGDVVIVAGGSTLGVARLSGSTGAPVWTKSFPVSGGGPPSGASSQVVIDPLTSDVVLFGNVQGGTVDFGGGGVTGGSSGQTFVAKLDGTGAYRWLTYSLTDHVAQGALDACGAVIWAGRDAMGIQVVAQRLAP